MTIDTERLENAGKAVFATQVGGSELWGMASDASRRQCSDIARAILAADDRWREEHTCATHGEFSGGCDACPWCEDNKVNRDQFT